MAKSKKNESEAVTPTTSMVANVSVSKVQRDHIAQNFAVLLPAQLADDTGLHIDVVIGLCRELEREAAEAKAELAKLFRERTQVGNGAFAVSKMTSEHVDDHAKYARPASSTDPTASYIHRWSRD